MSRTHWAARPLPHLGVALCDFVVVLGMWSAGAKEPEPIAAGAFVGFLHGILGLLARHRTLPHLRSAESFGAVVVARMQSRWTFAGGLISFAILIVGGVLLFPGLDQPVYYSAITTVLSFSAIASIIEASVLIFWSRPGGLPSNTSLERTRER